jgi:hypothetical protein
MPGRNAKDGPGLNGSKSVFWRADEQDLEKEFR